MKKSHWAEEIIGVLALNWENISRKNIGEIGHQEKKNGKIKIEMRSMPLLKT